MSFLLSIHSEWKKKNLGSFELGENIRFEMFCMICFLPSLYIIWNFWVQFYNTSQNQTCSLCTSVIFFQDPWSLSRVDEIFLRDDADSETALCALPTILFLTSLESFILIQCRSFMSNPHIFLIYVQDHWVVLNQKLANAIHNQFFYNLNIFCNFDKTI